jgi:deoxyribodipyrimidine photo-lyase
MSTSLLWLRTDLRLTDHEALTQAAARGPVLALYCLDPRQFRTLAKGFPKTSARRARFLYESLQDLRARLRSLGADLLVQEGRPEALVPAAARAAQAGAVFFHQLAGDEEQAVGQAVGVALKAQGTSAFGFHGHSLIHPDDLPFELNALPDLFTRFRVAVERGALQVRAPGLAPPPAGAFAPVSPEVSAATDQALTRLAERAAGALDSAQAKLRYEGGVSAGLARIEHYFWEADRLRIYKETRNGLLHADDSAKLSPWLALGCISPRELYAEVRRYERQRVRNESTYWMIFELLWRDYFYFVALKYGCDLFRAGGLQRLILPWRAPEQDAAARRDFESWCAGKTGFPLVDACMRELTATGFMSNRGRQNVASFLTKNLNIDWRWGAAWFESQLIDYDVSSNYGNWNYAAGIGNDARGFRFFNIDKQASDYDPQADFARHWLPELANIRGAKAHRPSELSAHDAERTGFRIGEDYPEPMVDLFESARRNEARYQAAAR